LLAIEIPPKVPLLIQTVFYVIQKALVLKLLKEQGHACVSAILWHLLERTGKNRVTPAFLRFFGIF